MKLIRTTMTRELVLVLNGVMTNLLMECSRNKLLRERTFDEVWCYIEDDVCSEMCESVSEIPAIIAVAKFGNIYALKTPDCLLEEQLSVFESFFQNAEEKDKFLVFSGRDYEAASKYRKVLFFDKKK